jgi:two-component system probable response regulator PhcQ
MYRVLLVDDEPNILSALRRSLAAIDVRQLDGEALRFEMFTTPEAAIERGEEQEFDLVISDYRMPSMNGVEFLLCMMKIQPAAPRMIISAFADRDVIIAAVNKVHLIRFIEKPWNDHDLREAVVSILGNGNAKPAGGERMVDRADDGGIDVELED